MGLRWIINKPTNFCNTFFFGFFFFWWECFGFRCLLLSFFGENVLFITCPNLVTKQVWQGRGMNRPNFFSFPQRKKETKERTNSTWWHRKQFFFINYKFFLCVLWYMVVSRRDGERLLFEAYPKLAQEPKYVYTYITRAVFGIRSIVLNPNSILRLFQRPIPTRV